MAALGVKKSLAIATPQKLNDASVAGAGTLDFVLPQHTNVGGDFSALFQVVGTLTTLTVALQVSLDGSTFNDVVPAASFLTTSAAVKIVTPVVAGGIYRLNITASSGGQDFWVTIN